MFLKFTHILYINTPVWNFWDWLHPCSLCNWSLAMYSLESLLIKSPSTVCAIYNNNNDNSNKDKDNYNCIISLWCPLMVYQTKSSRIVQTPLTKFHLRDHKNWRWKDKGQSQRTQIKVKSCFFGLLLLDVVTLKIGGSNYCKLNLYWHTVHLRDLFSPLIGASRCNQPSDWRDALRPRIPGCTVLLLSPLLDSIWQNLWRVFRIRGVVTPL